MRDRCSSASADDEDAHSAVHPEHRVCFFVMCYQGRLSHFKDIVLSMHLFPICPHASFITKQARTLITSSTAGTAQRKSSHLIHDPPFVRLMVSLPLSCILSCFSIASASVARPRR
ncbi:hypothetical protein M404DRAFT_711808 [Pisolithus tinctorius Marx 270]|uniref:Uncharacterized protein n=1 Tax=Pisolithus tinctorius Marx 270 TaxID=870435 RepID=A0A0C3IZ38_PISTI|nr:hypothetical protein M404DRAFT_711808 [Pisolithus tinctorius Marx 270]